MDEEEHYSSEDHSPIRHPPKKKRQVLSEDEDMSVEVNTYDCVYDAGTGPLKIEIIRDDNDCDTKEGTTSVPTSARCSEYSEESVAYHLFRGSTNGWFTYCHPIFLISHHRSKPT